VPLATFPGNKKKKSSAQFKIIKSHRYGDDVLLEGRFNH